MKRLIVDLDNTLCLTVDGDYRNAVPDSAMIERLRAYKAIGFEIVIHTSRNMRTFEGSIGKITAHTLPIILDWLNRNEVPYDEIIIGKPWCGNEGFYVDDRALRPAEFLKLSYEGVRDLLGMKP
jgi:capsule biosynthesis phosphatase